MYQRHISNPNPEAERFAQSLPAASLRGRIALNIEDPHAFALCFHRILAEGGTPVLAPEAAEAAELGVSACLTEDGLTTGAGPHQAAVEGAYVAFSSGSTGRRRPLFFSQERALANARAHSQALGLDSQHLLLQTLRLHHPFGVVAYLFSPLVCACSLELGTDFDNGFRQPRSRRTVVHLTPYHLDLMHQRQFHPQAPVACLTIGAGPLSRELAGFATSLCDQLHVTYGLSEAGPRVTSGQVLLETFVDGWIGYPLADIQTELLDSGELQLKTPYAQLGMTTVATGDRMEQRPDGSLIFRDRLGDLLRLRGQSVSREGYQARLQQLLGRPCQIGQRSYNDSLAIFLEGRPEQVSPSWQRTFPELKGASIHWVDAFPRTALGKVDRQRLLRESERLVE